MIEMRVQEIKFLFRLQIAEFHGRDHPPVFVAPGRGARNLRRIRQPEIICRHRFQALLSIKDGHKFAFFKSIITAHADPIVSRQIRGHVLQLMVQTFLGADEVGGNVLDEFAHDWTPLRPGVGRHRAGKAQVIGHHAQRAGSMPIRLIGQPRANLARTFLTRGQQASQWQPQN